MVLDILTTEISLIVEVTTDRTQGVFPNCEALHDSYNRPTFAHVSSFPYPRRIR